jgi:AcrR family transcriptional regulator
MSDEKPKRPYRLKERAESQERTRQRIAEAAMELHGSLGPAKTSISAVAQRAGVQRATVYRHFPDEAALFAACSAHWASLYPPPDPAAWAAVANPDERLRAALRDLYEWYSAGGDMLVLVLRDEEHVPERNIGEVKGTLQAIEGLLLEGRDLRGRRRERVAAAIGHAIDPRTHKSLTERGLSDDEAVAVMTAAVSAADHG